MNRITLQKLRATNKLTQQELANKVGISKAAYSNIENGRRGPSIGTAIRIAKALDTTVEKLFGGAILE